MGNPNDKSRESDGPVAALEVTTIYCPSCDESWAPATPGFSAAKLMLSQSLGRWCPSCQFSRVNLLPQVKEKIAGLQDIRKVIRSELTGISDLRHELMQALNRDEQDYVNEFLFAYFLFSCVPLELLKKFKLEQISEKLAEKFQVKTGG